MIFLQADMSQIESRIALAYTGDAAMLAIARSRPDEYDQHTRNASLIFGVPEADVTKDQRYIGKKAVHAAQRGARGKKLSEEMLKDGYVITPAEGDRYIDIYMARHQPLERLLQHVKREVVGRRALANTWGRVIRYDSAVINDELFREAVSFLLQSEASDLLLQWGLLPLWDFLRRYPAGIDERLGWMHIPVHDSLLVSCPPYNAYHIADFLRQSLERPRVYLGSELTVPVTFGLGRNWAMQHEFKRLPSREEFTEAALEIANGKA